MNFDIKDIKSWSNRHDAKVGDKGYFFNDIDNAKNDDCYCKPVRGTVEYIRDNYCYCFGIDKRGLKENYSFFLPLDKVKKTEPTEKKLKWRPCKDIEELEDLLNCDVLAFVGRVLELKDKSTGATIIVGITGTEELPIDSGSIYSIILGNGQVYSFADLFDKFEINVNDKWQPFGVRVINKD